MASSRHDQLRQGRDAAMYGLRRGMARAALAHKAGAVEMKDAYGRKMHAADMAERHSVKQLQAWAGQRQAPSHKPFLLGGMEFCKTCHRVPEWCGCHG